MNKAATKHAKISTAQEVKFASSNKTITKDIFRIISGSTHHQRAPIQSTCNSCAPANNKTNNNSQSDGIEDASSPKPPFP